VQYRIFDSVVASDWPLPELPTADGEPASVEIERGSAAFDDRDLVWFHEWRVPDEDPWLAAARLPAGGYLVRVPALVDFLIDDAGRSVRVVRTADTSDDTLRHLLLDLILPLVMTHRGELVLHASGALVGSGAFLFIARSGAGKSTIAAALAARGARVVADDAIAVRRDGDELVAIGAYSGLRLWPDGPSPAAKRRIGPGDSSIPFAGTPVRVAGIYVLEPSASHAICVDRLPPRESVMALVANSYVLDCDDPERLERQLDRAIACGRAVPIRRLAFPHDADRLEELCQAVLGERGHSA
jgi:hypothetical protein